MRSIVIKFKVATILIEETSNSVQFIVVYNADCSNYLKFDCSTVVKSNKQLNMNRIPMAKSMGFILFKIKNLKTLTFPLKIWRKNNLSYTKIIISSRISSIIMLAEVIYTSIPISTSRRRLRLKLWGDFIWTGTWHICVQRLKRNESKQTDLLDSHIVVVFNFSSISRPFYVPLHTNFKEKNNILRGIDHNQSLVCATVLENRKQVGRNCSHQHSNQFPEKVASTGT